MDAELYRRILCSKNFKVEGKVLREEIAVFTKNLLKIAYHLPSPGELLFDASAQSPPSEKTVEM